MHPGSVDRERAELPLWWYGLKCCGTDFSLAVCTRSSSVLGDARGFALQARAASGAKVSTALDAA